MVYNDPYIHLGETMNRMLNAAVVMSVGALLVLPMAVIMISAIMQSLP